LSRCPECHKKQKVVDYEYRPPLDKGTYEIGNEWNSETAQSFQEGMAKFYCRKCGKLLKGVNEGNIDEFLEGKWNEVKR